MYQDQKPEPEPEPMDKASRVGTMIGNVLVVLIYLLVLYPVAKAIIR